LCVDTWIQAQPVGANIVDTKDSVSISATPPALLDQWQYNETQPDLPNFVSTYIDPNNNVWSYTPNAYVQVTVVTPPEGAAAARGTFYAVLVYNGKTYVGVKEGHVAVRAASQ